MQDKTLINNAAATGAATTWDGGDGEFAVSGTFGGATVSLQELGPDGVTWQDVGTDTTLTAAGGGGFRIGPNQIRAAVTGGTPSAIYARVGLTTGGNSVTTAGSGVNAGNNADGDYAGNAGKGGAASTGGSDGADGNPGRVVLIW
jgi:hypothetical protein